MNTPDAPIAFTRIEARIEDTLSALDSARRRGAIHPREMRQAEGYMREALAICRQHLPTQDAAE